MSLLRRLAPKGLLARTLLIVALPIFVMQSVITLIFFRGHWNEVSGNLSANVAGDVAIITRLYEQAAGPISQEDVARYAREDLDIAIRFEEGGILPEKDKTGLFSVLNSTLDQRLDEALGQDYWYNTSGYWAYVEIRVQMADGYLVFLVLRERVFTDNAGLFILWLIGATSLLGYISIVFMRNQVRSITRLADAAEAFGRGRDMPDYKPSGATEVRAAGRAFMAMRQRINRHLNQRTTMLAGVSHDLRTPLTRMKLALAMQPDNEEMRELKADVNEMEQMLEEYLSFARDQNVEDPILFDLSELIEEIRTETERSGHLLEIDVAEELEIDARRNAIKRALNNLVTNGFKHAENVRLTAQHIADNVEIMIDDNGPGISPDYYDEAFKPFSRLDEARNQNITGVGLGLTVVRDVARAHGGDVTLSRAPMGGLRAILRIPV